MKYSLFPFLAWTIVVVVLSVLPSDEIENIWFEFPIPIDKIAHFGLYLILSFLLFLGNYWAKAQSDLSAAYVFFAFLSIIFFGSLLELVQNTNFVNRNSSFFDIIANLLGTTAGILLYFVVGNKIKFLNIKK